MKLAKVFKVVTKYIELKIRVIRLNSKLKKAGSKFRWRTIKGGDMVATLGKSERQRIRERK